MKEDVNGASACSRSRLVELMNQKSDKIYVVYMYKKAVRRADGQAGSGKLYNGNVCTIGLQQHQCQIKILRQWI